MSTDNQLAVQPAPAFLAVAGLTGLDAKYLVDTVKRQCFKGEATDAQVDAFISIACEMKVNPLLPGMLYAYPISGGGIVPIMGPSGVYKKLVEHPEVASWETEVFPSDVTVPPTHAVTKIWRKGVERPLVYTALLSEWKIESNPNWRTRPRHMLALRSLKHCANQIIHGIPYDEDDRVIMAMQNVTGTGDENPKLNGTPADAAPAPERPTPKPRATRGAAGAKNTEVVVTQDEQKASEQKPADAAPAQDIQQAMQAREAKVAEKPAEKTAETAKPAPVADAAPVVSRAFLNEGERYVTTAKVDDFKPIAANVEGQNVAAIRAILSGGYVGEVRQKEGGAKFVNNNTEVVALPPWQVGAVLKFTLFGKKASNGKVIPWVEAVGVEAENLD